MSARLRTFFRFAATALLIAVVVILTLLLAVAGLSGALYAGQVQYVAPPTFNIINSMLFLSAVVLGGQGNKLGVIFGAFVIVAFGNAVNLTDGLDGLAIMPTVLVGSALGIFAYVALGMSTFALPATMRFAGLEPGANYRVQQVELAGTAPTTQKHSPAWQGGVVLEGQFLMSAGLRTSIIKPENALLFEVTKVG